MKSYGQFIDKSIALDESIVGRYFDSSRFGPGGNKNVTTGLKPNVPTVRQQQKTKPNNPTKPPLRATSQRPQRPINNDNKKGRQAVRNIAQKVVAKASDPQVRSTLSGLNQIRKNLPTAADFAPTSQSGLGLGGTLKGRSFSSLNKFGNRNKFEPNEIVKRKGLGDNKVSQVIRRGRKLGPDGEPINEPKDTSFKGKAKNFLKRKLGITDKVDKPEKPDEPMGANRVTTTGPKPDDSGSKVTTGKGKPNPSSGGAEAKTPKSTATSGGKSKGADSVSVNVSDKKPLRRFTKKPEAPDKKIRVEAPKTDPSKLNKVKGFKDEKPVQLKTDGSKEENKNEKTPRTPATQATLDQRKSDREAAKNKALEDQGQGNLFNQDRKKVEVTGSKSPEITGTKTDKVTSSNNVDKTSKPVEKTVEKPKSNEVAITDTREKKPAGKKRGPKKGSRNVRTLARQNREKRQQETQAKERLASAVKKQEEQDKKNPIEQAKQDSKTSTALKGSNLDRNRKELAKMLKLTPSSKQKKSTQIQGISDEELARSGGSKKNIDDLIIKAKEGEAKEQEKLVNKEEEKTNKKKTINPNAPKSNRKNVKKSYNTTSKKKKTIKNEEFSHWREEFLWEVDKKYPDKVKEIKPMSGKNTITINPEDETSKYKRGY